MATDLGTSRLAAKFPCITRRRLQAPAGYGFFPWKGQPIDSAAGATAWTSDDDTHPFVPMTAPLEYVEYPQSYNDVSGGFTGGMKYRFSVAGKVVGIHVWIGSGVTAFLGMTVGLWLPDSTQLAKISAPALSSGWTNISFAAPVTVAANTTYVASVYWPSPTPQPVRSLVSPWPSAVQSGNVKALAQNEDGNQGFYAVGDAFPNTYWNGTAPVLSPLFQAS